MDAVIASILLHGHGTVKDYSLSTVWPKRLVIESQTLSTGNAEILGI